MKCLANACRTPLWATLGLSISRTLRIGISRDDAIKRRPPIPNMPSRFQIQGPLLCLMIMRVLMRRHPCLADEACPVAQSAKTFSKLGETIPYLGRVQPLDVPQPPSHLPVLHLRARQFLRLLFHLEFHIASILCPRIDG